MNIPGKFEISVDPETAELTVKSKLYSISVDEANELRGQIGAAIDVAKHFEAINNRIGRLAASDRAKDIRKPKGSSRKIPLEDLEQIFTRYRVDKESPKIIAKEYHVTDQAIINAVRRWAEQNPELAEEKLKRALESSR